MDHEDLRSIIDRWIQEAMGEVYPGKAITKHIDELVGEKLSPEKALTLSLKAYSCLVEAIAKRGAPVKPVLNIPLRIAEHCQPEILAPSTLEELNERLGSEPPLLAMVSWEDSRTPIIAQEYRSPLALEFPELMQEGVVLSFRSFRGEHAIANNWEFSTVITAEFYPG